MTLNLISSFPNKYILEAYDIYEEDQLDDLFYFYIIPTKRVDDTVVSSSEFCAFFDYNDYNLIKNKNLFQINGLAQEKIEELMEEAFAEHGFTDVSIGVLDNTLNRMLQISYVENFYYNKVYGLIDYIHNLTLSHFYYNNNYWLMRSENILHKMGYQSSLTNDQIEEAFNTLQSIYFDGEYDGFKYKDVNFDKNIKSMHTDIIRQLHNIIKMPENLYDNFDNLLYLEKLSFIQFFITTDEKNWTPIRIDMDEEGFLISDLEQSLFVPLDIILKDGIIELKSQDFFNSNSIYSCYVGFNPIFINLLKLKQNY